MPPEELVLDGDAVWRELVERLADKGFPRYVPQTDDELHAYIQSEYGFNIPRHSVCANHCSPFEALAASFFQRVTDCIVIGPRTGGKTLMLALLDHLLFYHFGTTIANVGAIDIQAQKCYSYFEQFATKPQFRDELRKAPMLSRTYGKKGGMVEIMPGTINRVNSPHPNRAHLDEIELMPQRVIEEAKSMPMRQGNRAPATIWTSSRKKPFGPMENLITEAPQRGIPIFKWCGFEIIEQCPPTRHLEGEGCKTCVLHDICKEKQIDQSGVESFIPGPGRASRAKGWMQLDDFIDKYRTIDWGVFRAQWLSERPESSGLAYPMFDEDIHIIDYEYQPAFPVVCGIDLGYVAPSVVIYIQPTPDDRLVVFAEDYRAMRTADILAQSMKRAPWFDNTRWRTADPANRGDRETLIANGVFNEPANKAGTAEDPKSVINGINLVRWALKPSGFPRPILYIAKQCVNTIREIKAYHHPDQKEDKNPVETPSKIDDHAMDAMRYAIMRIFAGQIVT